MADRRARPSSKQRKLADSGTLNPDPGAVTNALFQGEEFFDRADLLQVKYEMLRSAENDGSPVAKAAREFGFSRRHFYEIKKQFVEDGLQGLMPEKRGPKGAHKLDDSVMAFVLMTLELEPSLKAPALAALIKTELQVKVHPRSIERALGRKKKERRK